MFNQAGRWSPQLLAALRIVSGLLFLAHGVVKVFGFPAGAEPGQQALASLFGIGGIIELVTGGLILLGLFTPPPSSPQGRWRWPTGCSTRPRAPIRR